MRRSFWLFCSVLRRTANGSDVRRQLPVYRCGASGIRIYLRLESYKGISGFPDSFLQLSKFKLFGVIPCQVIIFLVLAVIAYVLLNKPSTDVWFS